MSVQVVHPRKLTALEWAILHVVEAFREAPPTLEEVAEELGIDDPGFLDDALAAALRLRALEPRGETVDTDSPALPDLDFTSTGYELFRRGQIEGEPVEHGETFFFDPLTDEAVTEPDGLKSRTDHRFPRTHDLSPRESVGLDRARQIVGQFHRDLVAGGGELRGVDVRAVPSIRWRPVAVDVRLNDGSAEWDCRELSQPALQYLRACDPLDEGVIPLRPVSEPWGVERPGFQNALSPDEWHGIVTNTTPVARVKESVQGLLQNAQAEVVLHACFLALDGVDADLGSAVRRGVKALVVGTARAEVFLAEVPRPVLGVRCPARQQVTPAVVADGTQGLVLRDVRLRVGEREAAIELAGALTAEAASALREELVEAASDAMRVSEVAGPPSVPEASISSAEDVDRFADEALGAEAIRWCLARLAFEPSERALKRLERLVPTHDGLVQLNLLKRVEELVGAFAPTLSLDSLQARRASAWRRVVAAMCRPGSAFDSDLFGVLVVHAPTSVSAVEVVDPAVAAWGRDSPDTAEDRRVDLLIAVAHHADRRWGGDSARGIHSWRNARDAALVPKDWSTATVRQTVGLASRALDRDELGEWAAELLSAVPLPEDALDLRDWIDSASPIRELRPAQFDALASDIVGEALLSHPLERESIYDASAGVVPAESLAELVLDTTSNVADVAGLSAEMRRHGFKLEAKWWRDALRAALPDPDALEDASSIARLSGELQATAIEWPALASVGRDWARQVLDNLPKPKEAAALAWWVREHRNLRPLLGEVARDRVREGVRRFDGQLRKLREDGGGVWRDVLDACGECGLDESTVDGLVAEARSERVDGGKKPKKRKRRKRR